jgi:hypothetical protein
LVIHSGNDILLIRANGSFSLINYFKSNNHSAGHRFVKIEKSIDGYIACVYWKEDGYLFKKQASKAKLVVNRFLLLSVVATSFQNCEIKHIFYILLLSLIINGTYYLYLQEIYEKFKLNQLQHWFFFTEKTVCKPYSLTQVFEYKLFLKRLK